MHSEEKVTNQMIVNIKACHQSSKFGSSNQNDHFWPKTSDHRPGNLLPQSQLYFVNISHQKVFSAQKPFQPECLKNILCVRSGCWGWLGWLFSFSPWRSSSFPTLPKPPPAKETIAQLVIFIWWWISKMINLNLVQICSMKIGNVASLFVFHTAFPLQDS